MPRSIKTHTHNVANEHICIDGAGFPQARRGAGFAQ